MVYFPTFRMFGVQYGNGTYRAAITFLAATLGMEICLV